MKTIKTLILVSFLLVGMTTSVFASWWNPFTWSIFTKKQSQKTENTLSIKDIKNEDVTKKETLKTVANNDRFVIGFENYSSLNETKTNTILSISRKSGNNSGLDLTGWSIESLSSGKSFIIPAVTKSIGYKGSVLHTIPPKNVILWPNEGISIYQQGLTEQNYVHETEEVSYNIYIPKNNEIWNVNHDTIRVKDISGNLVGEFKY